MSHRASGFSPSTLLAILKRYPHVTRYVVGLSGGADSVALLHALAAVREHLKAPVHALHVHHGLHPDADQWSRFCGELCQALAVPFRSQSIEVTLSPGESTEMAARRERYRVFESCLRSGDALLLAHHQDDQVETVLINLFNGAGQLGMAGIPVARVHNEKFHIIRPLIDFSRSDLKTYLERQEQNWQEDSSNSDLSYDRNYVRHVVLPAIRERWAGVDQCVARSARLQGEALEVCAEGARALFDKAYDFTTATLSIEPLKRMSSAQRRVVIRYWLANIGKTVNLSEAQLNRIECDFVSAAKDRQPAFAYGGIEVRRFGGQLYKVVELGLDPVASVEWPPGHNAVVSGLGVFFENRLLNQLPGLRPGLRLSFRGSAVSSRSSTLKKRFQERSIPPWERGQVPLLEYPNELKAIWGEFINHGND